MNPFQDFKSEIKLLFIVVIISVIISVAGILLVKTTQPPVAQTPPSLQPQTDMRHTSDSASSDPSGAESSEVDEIASPEQKLSIVKKFLDRGDWHELRIEGVNTPGLGPEYVTPFTVDSVLVIKDLETDEQKEFAFMDLLDENVFTYLKEKGAPPSLCFQVNKDSFALEGKTGWGRIDLFWCGNDFGTPIVGNYFNIDAENWEIETIEAPPYAVNAAINPQREIVLYDNLQDGLFLYLLELRTGKEIVVVSYSNETVAKYVNRALAPHGGYPYFGSEFSEKLESRALQPEWIDDDTFSYLDLETREKRVVNLATIGIE